MDIPRTIQVVTGIAHTAYGIGLKDKRAFDSPFAFDAYDMWFGADFDYILDELLDDFLGDVFGEELGEGGRVGAEVPAVGPSPHATWASARSRCLEGPKV